MHPFVTHFALGSLSVARIVHSEETGTLSESQRTVTNCQNQRNAAPLPSRTQAKSFSVRRGQYVETKPVQSHSVYASLSRMKQHFVF